ncbi:MAG: PAS domain S-box protein [Candidatus Omnitrophica bacterium]|nr:PAS domain S-box protein [Candidatus Omnitrophota bacterium]
MQFRTTKPRKPIKSFFPFRLSLRYKLALPVLLLVTLTIGLLFHTTFRLVRGMVLERNESRLLAIAEVFTESLKVPMILGNQQVLLANIEWMARRPDVLEVRVENMDGVIVGGTNPTPIQVPATVDDKNFHGVKRIAEGTYTVVVPIQVDNQPLGRLIILFSEKGLESELRKIFEERLLMAFLMACFLALMTAILTWIAIRPLFRLRVTVQEILDGDLSARAEIHTFDEIEDLSDAFNEMVSRLARSLDNLRSRTEALEESEEKYRLIVDNASDIIFTMTPEGHFILLNEGFSGCSREELLHEGLALFLSIHSEESREKFSEAIKLVEERKVLVTNLAVTHVHRTAHTEIFYLLNLTPVVDHEGHLKLIQGMMRDITELKRIEMMKESLIRDVAHELKTPTAKFEMAVNWFEKDLEKRQQREHYDQILGILKNNTDRLMRTITSIMDLSKLESGLDRIVKADFDLHEVLEQVRQDMEPLCRQKKIVLECLFTSEKLPIKGDRDMLYRLFVNLIGNAIKFTSEGKITLRSSRKKDQTLVEVSDTGIGLEKEDLERIFERFYQKTASSVGIGVGLTISRDIVILHEGKIWAESLGLGKGTIFKVQFPLRA